MSKRLIPHCQNNIFPDCRFCHRKHCVRYEKQCYYLIFGVNWYEARHACKQMSLNLVEIQKTNQTKYITDEGYNKDTKFWTAYHKEDWIIISPGKQGKSEGLLFHSIYSINQLLLNVVATGCSVLLVHLEILFGIYPTGLRQKCSSLMITRVF